MSRRAKESDASLAFSTTTIDDEFFWIFSSCCVLDLFFVCFGSLFVFCVHSIIQWRPKQCFLLHRENSLAKKDKKRKERNTKTNKMFTSPLFFLLGLYTLNMGPFFFSPLKILFLFFFEIDARLSVSRFDYTNAKRASKNDSSARLTPAPTKRRTREREKHAHTEREEHGQTQVESAASEKSPA